MPERRAKIRIRRGDMVVAIAGADRGKRGKVLHVLPETSRAIVEGLHTVKKHLRKSQDHPQGGIVEREAPMALSNLRKVEKEAE
jgi:large subunit ribosomal protein L24